MRWSICWTAMAAVAMIGCSDDTTKVDGPRLGDLQSDLVADFRVDGKLGEAGLQEGGTADAAKAFFYTLAYVLELEGAWPTFLTGAKTDAGVSPDAGVPALAKLFQVDIIYDFMTGGDPSIKPDYISGLAPPRCMAWAWTSTKPFNYSNGDAGKITITGHQTPDYVDPTDPGKLTPLPAKIECVRKLAPNSTKHYVYDCGLGTAWSHYGSANVLLPSGAAFAEGTKISFEAAGGANVPAYSVKDVGLDAIVKPKAPFDLTKVDTTKSVTALWEPTAALMAGVEIRAWLKDGSAGGYVFCGSFGGFGQHKINDEALALLPKPTASNPLHVLTTITPCNGNLLSWPWGTGFHTAGKGSFGFTCLTPTGFCN